MFEYIRDTRLELSGIDSKEIEAAREMNATEKERRSTILPRNAKFLLIVCGIIYLVIAIWSIAASSGTDTLAGMVVRSGCSCRYACRDMRDADGRLRSRIKQALANVSPLRGASFAAC